MRSARHVERSHGAMGRALKKDLLCRRSSSRCGETVSERSSDHAAGMKLHCRSGVSCIHARRRSQYSHILVVVVRTSQCGRCGRKAIGVE